MNIRALILSCILAPGPGGAQEVFDPAALLGDWFQVAETPSILNQDCHGTRVTVATREDRRLELRIACPKGALDGPVVPIEGIMVEIAPGVFVVRFVRLAVLGNLDLYVLDGKDGMMVLGSPGHKVGWVWARAPHPDEGLLAAAEAVLVANGYDRAGISRVEQAE